MARTRPPRPRKAGKTYFFSDAHLGLGSKEEDREKERRIIDFLSMVRKDGKRLFIVGDLFDYWFEYHTVVPKGYVRLFGKLAELSDNGIEITYVAGNHDFWMKDYFRKELGIEIFLDPIEREIDGKRFLIHHGDGLLKNDTGYRFLKRVLRNRINMRLFSFVHPDLAGRIARWSSRTSRKHTGKKSYEENDMVDFARQRIRQGFDVVIMGHNHTALSRTIDSGLYINLGDWIEENSYAVFDGKKVELRYWNTRSLK